MLSPCQNRIFCPSLQLRITRKHNRAIWDLIHINSNLPVVCSWLINYFEIRFRDFGRPLIVITSSWEVNHCNSCVPELWRDNHSNLVGPDGCVSRAICLGDIEPLLRGYVEHVGLSSRKSVKNVTCYWPFIILYFSYSSKAFIFLKLKATTPIASPRIAFKMFFISLKLKFITQSKINK